MIKVKNLYTALEIKDKNGKLVRRIQIENRLLDNYLDYVLWYMLPLNVANALFPKFDTSGYADYFELWFSNTLMQYAYVTKTAQVIQDTSTTMQFEGYSDVGANLMSSYHILTEELKEKSKIFTYVFKNIISENDGEGNPLLNDGDVLQGIGFGIESGYFTDYLLTYLDISTANMIYYENYWSDIVRSDKFETDENLLEGNVMYHLPGYRSSGRLHSIILCYGENGTIQGEEYNAEALTYTYISAGKVQISGFKNFHIENIVLYPNDTICPSDTLYPTQNGQKIKSIILNYYCTHRIDFYTPNTYSFVKTYVNIDDLDVSYENTDIKINLIVEKG